VTPRGRDPQSPSATLRVLAHSVVSDASRRPSAPTPVLNWPFTSTKNAQPSHKDQQRAEYGETPWNLRIDGEGTHEVPVAEEGREGRLRPGARHAAFARPTLPGPLGSKLLLAGNLATAEATNLIVASRFDGRPTFPNRHIRSAGPISTGDWEPTANSRRLPVSLAGINKACRGLSAGGRRQKTYACVQARSTRQTCSSPIRQQRGRELP
jgi:hypothetical protein